MRLLLVLLLSAAAFGQSPIDLSAARQAFSEVRQICTADNGHLWGHTLCGPMLFADPATHFAVANQPDKERALIADTGLYTGKLPLSQNIANTGVQWNGVQWSEIQWPLPKDRTARDVLLLHESFHRLQLELSLPIKSPSLDHLDTLRGRYLFRLELHALAAALKASGEARTTALRDALTFRAARFAEFPDAAKLENGLETNEGLAEYTGIQLAHGDAIAEIESGESRPSFVRSAAYLTDPAYGLLLDSLDAPWRPNALQGQPLDQLMSAAAHYTPPADLLAATTAAAKNYGGEVLWQEESARDTANQARRQTYQAQLVDGPVLRIPFEKMDISFDPNQLYPFGDLGTIYPKLRVSDTWGVLEVNNGLALIGKNWDAVTVPAPTTHSDENLSGPGWTLQLNPGYHLQPGARQGDYTVGKPAPR